ncbi:SAV_915 family protein [Micromonospora sp. NPDC093277]|uniref:SAV_915 family protein n=1 Tax=Micromonospora sp. NPDC093277 TaxID=3364291 RepID=UPI00381C165A
MDEVPDNYIIPVRTVPGRQSLTIRTGRLPQGQRVGLAFTTTDKLANTLGANQPWTRLCESALRTMLAPLGIHRIQVDPALAENLVWPGCGPVSLQTPSQSGSVAA